MTDHIEILDSQIEPDAPLTAGLAAQLRDNPIAMADGADGAPNITTNWVDANDGVPVYDSAVDGGVAEIVIPWDADSRFEYQIRLEEFGTSATASLSLQLWYETSAAWSAGISVTGGWASSGKPSGVFRVLRSNISHFAHICEYDYYGTAGTSFASFTRDLYIVKHATAQQITKIRLAFSGGSAITLGKVYLEKRMCYA